MIVEIVGVWEHNKGAMLMLEAIKQRLERELPTASLAVPASMSRSIRERHGLLGVVPPGWSRHRLKKIMRLDSGLIEESEVDVLLDASGFGYGDYWGETKLRERLADRLRRWKSESRSAIVLPQALGPFSSDSLRSDFRDVLRLGDLIFPRDRVSYDHVRDLFPEARENVRRAPDFTNSLSLQPSDKVLRWKDHFLVIPNEKIVKGHDPELRQTYLQFLRDCIQTGQKLELPTVILLHEGANDRTIAADLNDGLARPVEIVEFDDALDTKAVISQAYAIASSRFHGLVSALSAGVPALSCGWSHKYRELMNDYGVAEFDVSLNDPVHAVAKLEQLLIQAKDPAFRLQIAASASEEKRKTEVMWGQVLEVLERTALKVANE